MSNFKLTFAAPTPKLALLAQLKHAQRNCAAPAPKLEALHSEVALLPY
jgi:hypothetical protein